MIVFSDLDRTLIYSKKFIKDIDKLYCIEFLDGKEISYISKNTVKLLKDFMTNNIFIPTTTRSIEQFARIKFKECNVHFEYAITTNGGNILHNGESLSIWKSILSERLKECNSLEDTMNFFDKNYGNLEGILKVRSVDNMFFYLVVDMDIFDIKRLDNFRKELDEFNWDFYISGRKIYFIPKVLTKEASIEFLTEYLGQKSFFAMGDSNMDLNMLKKAERAFVPAKSAIVSDIEKYDSFVSKYEGFNGTEEIVKNILVESKKCVIIKNGK